MIRDEYLRRLIDASHVDLYLSANDGARTYWPWRMQPVHEACPRYRDACESYIVDSSIGDETITTEDTLDKAHEVGAEMAVLADVWHDMDATVDAVLDGMELYDDHPFDGKVLAPLQPPHDECYRELEGVADVYAIGGVKDAGDDARVTTAQSVREVAGPDVWLHGLGYGATDGIVAAVRESPTLLDSIDYSTPVQDAMNIPVESGDERMSVVGAYSTAALVRDLRRFSPYTERPEPEDLREAGQSGLTDAFVPEVQT